jgi:Bacterial TniB protein
MIKPENLLLASHLDRVIVNHTDFQQALTGIEDCIQKSKFYRDPIGCMLTAEGGHGKSTIGEILKSRMPQSVISDNNQIRKIVPLLNSSIPSSATIKGLASTLLKDLCDPNPYVGSTLQLTARLCGLLSSCNTEVIFLDEFHHLFKLSKSSAVINKEVANWIKALINETKICICLVGVPGFAKFFFEDTQYAGRFSYHFEIKSLKPLNRKNGGDIAGFFNELRSNMKTLMSIEFDEGFDARHSFYDQLYLATGGNPKFIKFLTKDAILNLLNGSRKEIGVINFSNAWKKGVTAAVSITKKDPFSMGFDELSEYF